MSDFLYGGEPDGYVGDVPHTDSDPGFADLFDFDGGHSPDLGGHWQDTYGSHEPGVDAGHATEHTYGDTEHEYREHDPSAEHDHLAGTHHEDDPYQSGDHADYLDHHDSNHHDIDQHDQFDPFAHDFLSHPFDASYDLIGAAPGEHAWWADLTSDHNHEGAYETVGYELDADPYVAQ
jgi:hypothetical protein